MVRRQDAVEVEDDMGLGQFGAGFGIFPEYVERPASIAVAGADEHAGTPGCAVRVGLGPFHPDRRHRQPQRVRPRIHQLRPARGYFVTGLADLVGEHVADRCLGDGGGQAGRAWKLPDALAGKSDLDRFAAPFAPDATWWTDSGRDRRRGRLYARGDIAANGPFHGVVPIADKLAAMRARVGSGAYASPAIAVTPRRVIADDELVAVEATGEALLGDGARYQNRYLWVADVGADGIRQLREYCDTLHVAELMGYDAWLVRTERREPYGKNIGLEQRLSRG